MIVTTLIVLSLAVSSFSISSSCQSTLEAAVTGPAASCLNTGGILALFIGNSAANTSLVQPVDSWLIGLCGQGTCNNTTLISLTNNLTSGCASDITALGIDQGALSTLPANVAQYYPSVRTSVCLRDTSANDTLCVSTILNLAQSALGTTLTLSNAISSVLSLIGNSAFDSRAGCSACAQAAYSFIRPSLPAANMASLDSFFTSTCGSGFVSAGKPTQIIVATGSLATPSATSPVKSNGVSPSQLARGAISVMMVSAIMSMLAFVAGGMQCIGV